MSDVEITIVKFQSYMMPDETVRDAMWRTLRYPGSRIDVHEVYWTQGNSKVLNDSFVTYDPANANAMYAQMCDRLADQLLGISACPPSAHMIPENYGSW